MASRGPDFPEDLSKAPSKSSLFIKSCVSCNTHRCNSMVPPYLLLTRSHQLAHLLVPQANTNMRLCRISISNPITNVLALYQVFDVALPSKQPHPFLSFRPPPQHVRHQSRPQRYHHYYIAYKLGLKSPAPFLRNSAPATAWIVPVCDI
ncbi:uncharacterized protein BCR38DRAFT_118776 [Pseudomassariella vexata]|uniref:Uncharacterized protein n=1 Tax=Pseudomassariella vexata TaxID=1141098 RepID=A0A1Y2DCM3_9PEZI|nr:uncharacterized protein BCR38DRAFT_118776 [Pseudomassariella vexata]ORY56425.1 hypothetical protein BCR38DRAFT_118776 [Pseudomassariella vexata]